MVKPYRIMLVGTTGKVGRMVLHYMRQSFPSACDLIEQHRDINRKDGYYWNIGQTPQTSLEAQDIDTIICLAGVTPVTGYDISENVSIGSHVLGMAQAAGVRRVLLASSSAVYGKGKGSAFVETDPPNPVNVYGEFKSKMEMACNEWRKMGLEVCCLRIGNVVGADGLLLNIAKLKHGERIQIDRFPNGGSPVRSYIGARTLAEVLMTLATQNDAVPEVLNVAAPGVVEMEDLAKAAGCKVSYSLPSETSYQFITMDCGLLSSLYDFKDTDSDPCMMVSQWKEAQSL
jgi:UDP-glucose 4-epimerase